MGSKIQNGYLTLADISGYTSFMAQTELEHSQAILSDLLHLVIERLTPMSTLAEVEGDAVFVYAPEQNFARGETLLELIESTYFDFRMHRDVMVAKTTCTCRACKSIPQLDLKFITHYGSYALQAVAGSVKPVGSDVNLAHRLLKNKVSGDTGWQAYALFSEPAISSLRVTLNNAHERTESYEHLGDVVTRSYNLNDSLERISDKKTFKLTEDNSDIHLTCDFPTSKVHLWTLLNDHAKRETWMRGKKWKEGDRPNGRTDVGAVNHCYHGKNFKERSVEIIRDWKPFDYYTAEQGKRPIFIYVTAELESIDGGTRVHLYLKIKNKFPKWLSKRLAKLVAYKEMNVEDCWKMLTQIINEELQRDNAAA